MLRRMMMQKKMRWRASHLLWETKFYRLPFSLSPSSSIQLPILDFMKKNWSRTSWNLPEKMVCVAAKIYQVFIPRVYCCFEMGYIWQDFIIEFITDQGLRNLQWSSSPLPKSSSFPPIKAKIEMLLQTRWCCLYWAFYSMLKFLKKTLWISSY